MDFKRLRYFIAIVEEGSLSKAAKKLFVAQTSLSEHLKILENEFNVQLLERHSQGIRPTSAGQAFYDHANSILKMQKAMIANVRSIAGKIEGPVSVGMPNSVAEILAAPLLNQTISHLPQVQLSFYQGLSVTLEQSMRNGKLDIMLLFVSDEMNRTNEWSVHPLLTEEIFVVASKSSLDMQTENVLSILKKQLFICPGREHALTKLLENYALLHEIKLNIGAEADSLPAMIGTVATGVGYALLAGSAAKAIHIYPDLVLIPLVPPLKRYLLLCQTKEKYIHPTVIAVKDLILKLIQELVETGKWKGSKLNK